MRELFFERYEQNPYDDFPGRDVIGYSLEIYSPDWDDNFRYTLTGQVYGFGEYGGNHDAEEWLKSKMDDEHLHRIVFDSESGQFFCYSDSLKALKAVPEQMDVALDILADARKAFL